MTANPKPEPQAPQPGTAVARSDVAAQKKQLDADGARHIAEIRARNALVVAITNESWGERMSPTMRRAFAEYMRRFHLDVSEVDNLGGRPYRNGRYYERKISELRSAGKVDWTTGEHIGPDARLDALIAQGDAWAKDESARRLRERIRWAVPDDATHAYVTRVKLKGDQNPLEGCDWITPKRTKKTKFGEKIADPVGADEPEKTVITRAWRRVGLVAAAEIPELHAEEQRMDTAADEVTVQIEEIRDEEATRELSMQRPAQLPPKVATDDPYAIDASGGSQSRDVVAEPATPRAPSTSARAAQAASTRDPYDPSGSDPDDAMLLDLDARRMDDEE